MRDNGIPVTGEAAFADRPRPVERNLVEQEMQIIDRHMRSVFALQRRAGAVARQIIALRYQDEAQELEDRLLGNMIDVLGR